MSKNDGGPASVSLTLRDWFAGMAMQSLIKIGNDADAKIAVPKPHAASRTAFVLIAYGWADAMLAERDREGTK